MNKATATAFAVFILLLSSEASARPNSQTPATATEVYAQVPMPQGIQVIPTELEGPVFADANGKTLYKWPQQNLRNGFAGDPKNASTCANVKTTVSAGLMSPYPPDLVLPELDRRRSCVEEWRPVIAPADAKPIGDWTLIRRNDGKQQWAYGGQALYTFILDESPGDVLGGTSRRILFETAPRQPVGPPPAIPPGFMVITTASGRLVADYQGNSVYASSQDAPNRSNCHAACAATWIPVEAPALAQPLGEWTLFERAPGVRQWAFRGRPLYTYARETGLYSQQGSDLPGWSNVYTQKTPEPPPPFTRHDTQAGIVVADDRGMTVYSYNCFDDSLDQLSCDYPGAPLDYKLALCGGGDVERCLKTWPYVIASSDAKSTSRAWSVIQIDPATGRLASESKTDRTLQVWAYRGRPVHTYAGDEMPGDINGNGGGEFAGARNGFRAMWIRDDFFRNDM